MKGRSSRSSLVGDFSLILFLLIPFGIRFFLREMRKEGCLVRVRCGSSPFFLYTERCRYKGVDLFDLSEVLCGEGEIKIRELNGREALFFGRKININEADEEALIPVPGIGERLAGEILSLRERKGRFKSIGELIEVKGIGPKTLQKLEKFVEVK